MGKRSGSVNEKAIEAKERKALDKFVKAQRAKKQEEVGGLVRLVRAASHARRQ